MFACPQLQLLSPCYGQEEDPAPHLSVSVRFSPSGPGSEVSLVENWIIIELTIITGEYFS